MVSQTVMWTVDSAMVGHVGKTELAAVGLGGLLVWTIYSFFVGLSYSVSTYVAQSYGARKLTWCGAYLWHGLYIGLVSGAIIIFIRYFNSWTVDLLGPAPEVKDLCVSYAGIRMLSAPFFIFQYTFSNFFRGLGDTKTPMKVMILANCANIVLDYFLIFGNGPFPTMGVAGAAWATFIANVLSAVAFASITFSGLFRSEYNTTCGWRLNKTHLVELLKIGMPIGLHYFLDIGSFLIFSAYVGRMGTEQLAANQIVIQVLALSFMPCHGFSVAATTLMGQYIGAGRHDLAKKSAYATLRLGIFYSGFIGMTYVLLPVFLVKIFNDDPLVVFYGKRLIYLAAVFQLFDAVQMISAGALRGAGDTKTPMILALGGGWFLFLPMSFVFGTVLAGGVVGAWGGATLYVVFLGIAMFLWLKKERWKGIKLVKVESSPEPGQTQNSSNQAQR
ncbi:MAG: MATE family efflux transporter [Candidatus Latescibacterota bacterium]|nr:MAG: MATE family efflux transporter [Candidatus Latescibacterota bacterium]